MLQKVSGQDLPSHEVPPSTLSPTFILQLVKRRILHFIAPFLLVLMGGALVVSLLPAVYLSEGKILVESQQIPTELVRPTVTALANERIQVIEQRIMTRDRLLAVANKFQLFSGRQKAYSGTEMLDFIRARTLIRPLELKIPVRNSNRAAIAFTIGFEHERADIAMKVASELVTMILEEDVRTRTVFASETTRFLDRESKRLEGEIGRVAMQIAELRKRQARAPGDVVTERQLVVLRSELLQKSASLSESHPDMKAIKQKVAALEQMISPTTEDGIGLDTLERTQEALQKSLEDANQKLGAARLGETLERGQQSEKLEMIEQPVVSGVPVRPKRSRLMIMVVGLALLAGLAVAFLPEFLDNSFRGSDDFYRVVDSHLVVTIPYIATAAELRSRRLKTGAVVVALGASVAVFAATWLFLLPKLQILTDRFLAFLHL